MRLDNVVTDLSMTAKNDKAVCHGEMNGLFKYVYHFDTAEEAEIFRTENKFYKSGCSQPLSNKLLALHKSLGDRL